MIACPNCNQPNLTGAAFCAECGAALLPSDSLTTQDIEALRSGGTAESRLAGAPSPPAHPDNWVTLHLLDTGQVLPLAERNEFTLGRSSEGQPVMPDIDLAPYRAYSRGVSRLHAVIRRDPSDIVLIDLDSANGTFINGKRLKPNEEQSLANGDVVALGRLKIQILLRIP
jgi:hypothetical protein